MSQIIVIQPRTGGIGSAQNNVETRKFYRKAPSPVDGLGYPDNVEQKRVLKLLWIQHQPAQELAKKPVPSETYSLVISCGIVRSPYRAHR